MIKISIETDGKKIFDSMEIDNPTLKECALINYKLDQIKKDLIDREFESEFEVMDGDYADKEDED